MTAGVNVHTTSESYIWRDEENHVISNYLLLGFILMNGMHITNVSLYCRRWKQRDVDSSRLFVRLLPAKWTIRTKPVY